MASVLNGTTTYQFIVVGTNGTVLSSADAITWTAQNANTTASLNALSATNQFLAVGANGTIITSADGINWTRQVSNTSAELKTLLRAENQYIAVNTAGGIVSSK